MVVEQRKKVDSLLGQRRKVIEVFTEEIIKA